MKRKNNILEDLLNEISPLEQAKTDAKMGIAALIQDRLNELGWRNKDLLQKLEKDNPSIITKWLSGTQNFTIDTLVELEHALDISLLNREVSSPMLINKYEIVVQQKSEHFHRLDFFSQLEGSELMTETSVISGFFQQCSPTIN